MMFQKLDGTTREWFKIGNFINGIKYLYANIQELLPPAIRWNDDADGAPNRLWEAGADGVTFQPLECRPSTTVTVGPYNCDFQLIQPAIDYAALTGAGAPWLVLVQPGNYSESLVMAENVSVVGEQVDGGNVFVFGSVTWPDPVQGARLSNLRVYNSDGPALVHASSSAYGNEVSHVFAYAQYAAIAADDVVDCVRVSAGRIGLLECDLAVDAQEAAEVYTAVLVHSTGGESGSAVKIQVLECKGSVSVQNDNSRLVAVLHENIAFGTAGFGVFVRDCNISYQCAGVMSGTVNHVVGVQASDEAATSIFAQDCTFTIAAPFPGMVSPPRLDAANAINTNTWVTLKDCSFGFTLGLFPDASIYLGQSIGPDDRLVLDNVLFAMDGQTAVPTRNTSVGSLGSISYNVSTTRGTLANGYGAGGPTTAVTAQSAAVQIESKTGGFLPPRMTSMERTGIGAPATGLVVYDTNTNTLWYFNGTVWVQLIGADTASAIRYQFDGQGYYRPATAVDVNCVTQAFVASGVILLREIAGTSGTTELDILVNGASMFLPANRPKVTAADGDQYVANLPVDNPVIPYTARIEMNILTVEDGDPQDVTLIVYKAVPQPPVP